MIALFVLGAALFAYLVAGIGVGRLAADAAATGWMIVPIVLLFGVVHACSTQAWRLTLQDDPGRPAFWRAYAMLVAGTALNYVTPLVNAGGEPYRVAALAAWVGTRRAAGSVLLHRMLHALATLLVWLTALLLAFVLLPRDRTTAVLLAVAATVLLSLLALLVLAHRHGLLGRVLDLMPRIPLLDRLARVIEPRRAVIAALDQQITDFYHRERRRFLAAIGCEYLARAIYMVELVLIAASIGVRLGYPLAFAIGGLELLLGNVLFFIPFELGAREGAFYLLFDRFGFDPQLGVYVAIVSRVRDLTWIAGGLFLMWAARRRAPASA